MAKTPATGKNFRTTSEQCGSFTAPVLQRLYLCCMVTAPIINYFLAVLSSVCMVTATPQMSLLIDLPQQCNMAIAFTLLNNVCKWQYRVTIDTTSSTHKSLKPLVCNQILLSYGKAFHQAKIHRMQHLPSGYHKHFPQHKACLHRTSLAGHNISLCVITMLHPELV